jgi:hypothetical protein
MPCYFLKPRIKALLNRLRDVTQRQIEEELLKVKSDDELHEMEEDVLYNLIMIVYEMLRKKKMRKEATLIYI